MRTLLSGERTNLAQQSITFRAYVEVENVDGSWVNVTSRFVSADITTDVDQPVWSAVIAFQRDDSANTASLSPLRSDSTLNVDNSADYAPLLTAGREIKLYVATVGPSVTPTFPTDYRLLFHGRIDKPSFGQTPMTVECRDLGGLLIDTIIHERVDYGEPETGIPVAAAMQNILNNTLGENAPTLVDDLGSDFVVTSYTPLNIPVMEAMSALAIKAGGAVARYRFQPDGTMALTLYDPVRGKTTPDATIPPTEYLEIPDASIDSANVRNIIRGEFIDPVTGELTRITPDVTDTDSVAAFGPRFMQIGADLFEGMTGNQVLDVLNAALSDLAYPKFDKVVGCLLWWPAEVGDLYRFTANDVHYDSDQDLAVMGVAHHLEQGHGTTRFTCRGTPAGAYVEWIRRQGTGPTGPQIPPAPELMFLLGEATQFGGTLDTVDGAIWLGYRMPAGVDEIRVHVLLGQTQASLGVPNIDNTTLALTIRRPEGDIGRGILSGVQNRYPTLPGEYASMAILSTRPGMWKRVLFYGVRGALTSVPVIPRAAEAVDPTPVRVDGTIASLEVVRSGSTNTVTVTPGTLDTDPASDGNWLLIMRNEHVLPPIFIQGSSDPVVFVDSGLPEDATYEAKYLACIWNGGQSGPLFGALAEAPTIVAPEFANGTPLAANVSGQAQVEISWTCATPSANSVQVQASLDGVSIRVVGEGDVASDTVYDTVPGPKLYRLVARSLIGNALAYSPWKNFTGIVPPLSNPGAQPQIVSGYPRPDFYPGSSLFSFDIRLVIKWVAKTPNTAWVRIQESDDNGATDPWALVTNGERTGSSGTWYSANATPIGQGKYYRVQAIAIDGTTVLGTSAPVHYVPKS